MAPTPYTIKQLIERLTEIFSKDPLCPVLRPNSFLTFDPEEGVLHCKAENPKERAEQLLNYVLQRRDTDYRKLLDQLETLRSTFPALSHVLENEEKRNKLTDIIKQYKDAKLTLRDILDIGKKNMDKCSPISVQDLPLTLLWKLAALERTARDTLLLECDAISREEKNVDDILGVGTKEHMPKSINPLDVLCVLLNCSDLFLQQEIFSKMALCQFAVPLLLPAGNGPECTFMLWAMRDIVRSWKPQASVGSTAFIEESLVNIPMPCFSFLKLGHSKLSKSKILNQVLSPVQQYNDFFIHENMAGGNIERQISNGLVEISWCFPVGNEKCLTFPEPIAITNIRGNLEFNKTQLDFLMQVSAAVFVFAENINEEECEILSQYSKSDTPLYFIITPSSGRISTEAQKSFKKIFSIMNTGAKNILRKGKEENESGLVNKIRDIIRHALGNSCKRITLEDMSHTATKLGFLVDEMCDECQRAKARATEITKEIRDVVQYKKETLKLQGELWKKVSQTEKELCRMRKQGDLTIEQYNSVLRKRLLDLRNQQSQHPLTKGMILFTSAVTQLSQKEKHYFLKWMKFTLDSLTRKIILELQVEYKEKIKSEVNKDELILLGQKISDSSLGIEHFLREMGQFYESECSMVKISPTSRQFTVLPKIAADLLLDGFPLELMDGDASNIPLQWVTDILTELDYKTGGNCKMRVISVLGVQSTGKSTLLNTMFGLQFPVASGQCTRGAFMTLIKVENNVVKKLGCDFVLVIDTEGLKAPELASLEDSYEHDNELATLVVGLSDITIINITGENLSDIKDILQIVVHAFFRMKTIKREKSKCQFVHQNVSDVSADDNNIMDRTTILEQLNQMTRAAASMEKISGITDFCDILDYSLDFDHRYIPGLWYGDPPMASVNTGYSENVYELKKHLFALMEKQKSIRKPHNIREIIKHIKSLWNSVKHENFIFSFRNSLVAEAYNRVSIEYSQWEWNFCKQVHTWLISTENTIKNQSTDKLCPDLCMGFKSDLNTLLYEEEKIMSDKLEKYFESKSNNVHLIERYRADFSQDVKCFRKEMARSTTAKVDDVFQIQTQKHQLQEIQNNYQRTIEENVTSLLEKFRRSEAHPGDKEVKDTFENMWESTLSELPRNPLETRDIGQEMLQEIRMDMVNRGGNINEKILMVKSLGDFGKNEFKVIESHIDIKGESLLEQSKELNTKEYNDKIQAHVCFLAENCSEYVTEKVNIKGDFDRTYCKELLYRISSSLREKEFENLHFTQEFELDLKLHILGNAAPRFQMMHNTFLRENDPVLCLQNLKPQYWLMFEYIFKKKDETQSRAWQFCELCLKPAIMKHIFQHIGNDIVDDILNSSNGSEYCSRTLFQFTVLKKLLEQQDFSQFVKYINSYEWFVKRWIIDHILDRYSDGQKLEKMQINILTRICNDIKEVLHSPELLNKTTVSDFLAQFCLTLESKLVIPQEAIKVIVFQSKADILQFSRNIEEFLTDSEKAMETEFTSVKYSTEDVLFSVSVKPEDVLFKKVFGCGKQCPFCKVPCEAGGNHHEEHFASIHRPEGLGRCTSSYYIKLFDKLFGFAFKSTSHPTNRDGKEPQKLCTDICSTHVISKSKFSNADTAWKWHPFKEYRTFYPDWLIQPDPSITASDYWKYIFTKFNNKFAEEYEAEPADLPETWCKITKEQALQSLREAYILS